LIIFLLKFPVFVRGAVKTTRNTEHFEDFLTSHSQKFEILLRKLSSNGSIENNVFNVTTNIALVQRIQKSRASRSKNTRKYRDIDATLTLSACDGS
jgi:hypothetical protein